MKDSIEVDGVMYHRIEASDSSPASAMLGKYVIVRSRNEGVNAGLVLLADETGVFLKGARRLWYHKPAGKSSWYEGVSVEGLSIDSKCSARRDKAIIEPYSMVECTEQARKSIEDAPSHEQG